MIVRYVGEQTLMDCEALATETRRPVSTIRRHCTTVATDPTTGRNLYNRDQAITTLATIPQRNTTTRTRRS